MGIAFTSKLTIVVWFLTNEIITFEDFMSSSVGPWKCDLKTSVMLPVMISFPKTLSQDSFVDKIS
jgi:hypothetical protein